jgi:NitT/TauT family transport system permease protein
MWIVRAALLATILGGWAWLTRVQHWQLLIGRPADVARQLRSRAHNSGFWSDIGLTLLEAALGYVLGVLVAVGLVALIVPIPALDRFATPFIAMANALPKIVLAPVFILWFGFSLKSKLLFVAAGIFFVVFYGVHAGVRSIDRVHVGNIRVLGASRYRVIVDVYLPSIVGWLISSLRLSAAWALTAAVISEYLDSNRGIGFRIAQGQQLLDPNAVLAGLFAVATIVVCFDRVLVLVESRFTQWRVF